MRGRRLPARLLLACLISVALAADWPGWRGPDRTGLSAETGLLKQWPKGGPKLLWTAMDLGGGYATPSVASGRVFLLGMYGTQEKLLALDARDGKVFWSIPVGKVGENRGPQYPGPRCAPTIDGDRLYVLGSDGDLLCVASGDGKVLWRKHLVTDFQGNRPPWAYAEGPLLDGDMLVCTPGGPTATMVALNKKTGEVIWKTKSGERDQAGYASAIIAEAGGVKQYVQFLGSGLIGVAAKDGQLLWRYNKHIGFISATTPIFHDGCVFSSCGGLEGSGGDVLLRLTADASGVKAKQLYLVRSILNSHGGTIRIGDHVYGTAQQALVCMDFKTGERKWRERSVGQGSLCAADGHLYLRNERGVVALVEATPEGYKEKGRLQQPQRSNFATFCHPVVADGKLYLRDAELLFCYDIKEK